MTLYRFLLTTSPLLVGLTILAGIVNGLISVGVLAVVNRSLHHVGGFPTVLALTFLGLMAGKLLTSALSEIMLVRCVQDTVLTLTDRLCRSVVGPPFRHLERIGIPRVLTVLTTDVGTLAEGIHGLPSIVINGTIVLGCGAYLAWLSWPTFLGVVGLTLIGGATYRFLHVRAVACFRRARDQ